MHASPRNHNYEITLPIYLVLLNDNSETIQKSHENMKTLYTDSSFRTQNSINFFEKCNQENSVMHGIYSERDTMPKYVPTHHFSYICISCILTFSLNFPDFILRLIVTKFHVLVANCLHVPLKILT